MSALHGAPWQFPCLDLSLFCSRFPLRAVLGALSLVVLAGTEGEAVCDRGFCCHLGRRIHACVSGKGGGGLCGLAGFPATGWGRSKAFVSSSSACASKHLPLSWVSGASRWDKLSKSKAGTPQPAVCGEGRSGAQG